MRVQADQRRNSRFHSLESVARAPTIRWERLAFNLWPQIFAPLNPYQTRLSGLVSLLPLSLEFLVLNS